MLQALHNQLALPAGAAFTAALNLSLPPAPTLEQARARAAQGHEAWPAKRGRLLGNVVLARDDCVRVYEVREPGPDAHTHAHGLGPELREGESFDGEPVQARFHMLCSHQLFGVVTGLAKVRTIASAEDSRDRLLVSFKDAKIALLEWSDIERDLITVSIHTYERASQLAHGLPHSFYPALAVDPADRCAALLLPQDAIAILPFLQDTAELELFEGPQANASRSLPYAPSFVLPFSQSDPKIRGVRDIVFLPGFQKPTLAVLYAAQQTWTGRLAEAKDTCSFAMITLDMNLSTHPVISERHGLPYDAFRIIACPQRLGGCMIMTPSAILHIDQASKVVGTAVSGWHALSSALELPHAKVRKFSDATDAEHEDKPQTNGTGAAGHKEGEDTAMTGAELLAPLELELQGSELFFTDDTSGWVLMKSSRAFRFRFQLDGRSISALSIPSAPEHSATLPSSLSVLDAGRAKFLLTGSMAGDTVLQRIDSIMTTVVEGEETEVNGSAAKKVEDDMELDVDLYGEEAAQADDSKAKKQQITRLTDCDRLQFLGSISDMCERAIKGSTVSSFVATVGAEAAGGLASIEPQVIPRKRRRLNVEASDGIWDVTAANADPAAGRRIVTTSGGTSQLLTMDESTEVTPIRAWDEPTLQACPLQGSNFFARLSPDAFEVLTAAGEKVASFASVEDESFLECHIQHKHVVIRTNAGLRLVQLQLGKKQVLKPLNTFAGVADRYYHAAFIDDSAQPADLVTLTEESHIEVYDLATGTLRWRSRTLLTAASRLDAHIADAPHPDVALELVSAAFFSLQHMLHCAVLYKNGLFVVYEACRWQPTSTAAAAAAASGADDSNSTTASAGICFVKRLAEFFGPTKRLRATPFHSLGDFDGVFLCGTPPRWILRSPQSGVRLFVHDRESTHGFAKIGAPGTSVIAESHGAETWLAEIGPYSQDLTVLHERHQIGRTYSKVRWHPRIRAVVAASSMDGNFVLFEPEEGTAIGTPETDPIPAKIPYGSVELFVRDLQAPVHGYELEPNEMVTAMEIVSLDTMSHLALRKEFVAVGTTWFHGEDRPTRGATYIFDIVEVVSDGHDEGRNYRLRLLGRDDFTKGPVTAITDLNGYIVTAVGQKLFVRAFEQDQWLVAVAFLDMFFYTTSLRKLKNFLIATDAQKSVSFIMFQEEPYRLFSLGRDYRNLHLTGGDFLVSEKELVLTTTDLDGVVRLVDYNPAITTSHGGQRLLLRTEFQTAAEAACTVRLPRYSSDEEAYDASEIILGKMNGSIETLIPVQEQVFKRLQVLQGQLVRNVQHMAGLNPRAYRAVHNDFSTRPLAKGILDGTLLDVFVTLSWPRMVELASGLPGCIGGPQQVLDELYLLRSAWLLS
ncbi:mRNA cleavage and polyadenylation factor subunit [Tilletia horrida]|nr:mRNA cleavage and polyadenylation factor subunit [Tilletia horrida]